MNIFSICDLIFLSLLLDIFSIKIEENIIRSLCMRKKAYTVVPFSEVKKRVSMGASGKCVTCGKLISYGQMYCARCRPR